MPAKVRAVLVALLGSLFALAGCAPGTEPGSAIARKRQSGPAKTEVVIIGSLGPDHDENANYNWLTLQNIVIALKPRALCLQLGTEFFNPDGSIRQDGVLSHPEQLPVVRAAKALGVTLLPVGTEDRDEHRRQTRYFPRRERLHSGYKQWLADLSEERPESLDVRIAQLYEAVNGDELDMIRNAPPEVTNSESFDHLIRIKHYLWHDILPSLMAADPRLRNVAVEAAFFRQDWQEENEAIAEEILRAAARFAGGRIVVVTQAEHRYMLRHLLASASSVTLKEYWAIIPEQTRAEQRQQELAHSAALKKRLKAAEQVREKADVGRVSWQEAEKAYRAVLELEPCQWRVHDLLGRIYTRWGQHEKALSFLPASFGWPSLHRAFCLDALGRRKEALELYRELSESLPGSTIAVWAERGLRRPLWPKDLDIKSGPGEVRLAPTQTWRASASCTHELTTPQAAVDGDSRTRWVSGGTPNSREGQAPGQWFQLDFGRPQLVSLVVFDHQGTESINVSAWPRAAQASLTTDGVAWHAIPSIPAGPLLPLMVPFREPQSIRGIRLQLTGAHRPMWWAVHEVYVFSPRRTPGRD